MTTVKPLRSLSVFESRKVDRKVKIPSIHFLKRAKNSKQTMNKNIYEEPPKIAAILDEISVIFPHQPENCTPLKPEISFMSNGDDF